MSKDKVFPVLLVIFGCICLTVTDGWYVYTEPIRNGSSQVLAKLGVELPDLSRMWEDWQETGSEKLQGDNADEEGMESAAVSPGDEAAGVQESEESGSESSEETTEQETTQEETQEEESWEPVYQTVEDDYFNDAVFIGDSRTVGMYEYSNLKDTSTFYASVGLSVHKLFTAKIVEVPGQRSKITVEQALTEQQFAKVYFMLGINEMGTGTPESFLEKYKECVDRIRELQPDAIIYLQGIMQVTTQRSAQGDYITNEGIALRNEGIRAMADDESIFYLEINEAVCDENGGMVADYTHDGVHLKAQYIDLWKDYLKTHAIVRE